MILCGIVSLTVYFIGLCAISSDLGIETGPPGSRKEYPAAKRAPLRSTRQLVRLVKGPHFTQRRIWLARYVCCTWVAVGLWLGTTPVNAQQRETVGMVTEIRIRSGDIEVKKYSSTDWKPVRPLLALQAGDVVRVTADASVIIILSGEVGAVRIDSGNSPFEVSDPRIEHGRVQRALLLLGASMKYLSVRAEETLAPILVTRGDVARAIIVSPRNGPVLPGTLAFELSCADVGYCTVAVLGSKGPLVEQTRAQGGKFIYPKDGPRLVPGQRYRLRIRSNGQDLEETWFEVIPAERARIIQTDLRDLDQSLSAGVPLTSVAIIKAGLLLNEGLVHDARLLLVDALDRDPDASGVHLLLGDLYSRSGRPDLAAQFLDRTRGSAR